MQNEAGCQNVEDGLDPTLAPNGSGLLISWSSSLYRATTDNCGWQKNTICCHSFSARAGR